MRIWCAIPVVHDLPRCKKKHPPELFGPALPQVSDSANHTESSSGADHDALRRINPGILVAICISPPFPCQERKVFLLWGKIDLSCIGDARERIYKS